MVASLVALSLLVQDPPSVEDVRKNVYRAVREIRRYRETWLLSTSEKDVRPMTIKRWLDGPRYRQEILIDGRQIFAAGHDTTTGWFVSHENKQFVERREPNRKFDAPYELGPVPEVGEFKLGFVSPYDLDFRANPNWKVERLVEAKVNNLPVRRLDAVSKRSDLRYVNLSLQMDQEGWLLTRVVVNGRREDGTRFWQELRLTDRQFGAPMDQELFHLAASSVAGYTRLEKNPLDDGK
ncbi:MAG: hypothetical protein ACO1SV_16085 [Fimbriimonas sp.]